tara:strand:+ start:187 stop:534 length:348 start_codon:yes stop_codon:yes gene_type:complete
MGCKKLTLEGLLIMKTTFIDFATAILEMKYEDIPQYVFDFCEVAQPNKKQKAVHYVLEIARWKSKKQKWKQEKNLVSPYHFGCGYGSKKMFLDRKVEVCDMFINDNYNSLSQHLR